MYTYEYGVMINDTTPKTMKVFYDPKEAIQFAVQGEPLQLAGLKYYVEAFDDTISRGLIWHGYTPEPLPAAGGTEDK